MTECSLIRHSLLALTIIASLGAACVVIPVAQAITFEAREFPSESARARYLALIAELRCLVCQNQNIADSDADLAADLRNKVFELIGSGLSDTEIVDYMVARYGDFVMYRPPVKAVTAALWIGPGILLALGLAALYLQISKQRARAVQSLSAQERSVLEELTKREP